MQTMFIIMIVSSRSATNLLQPFWPGFEYKMMTWKENSFSFESVGTVVLVFGQDQSEFARISFELIWLASIFS